ncbi:hypothetical protein FMUBM48_08080 [Nocardia cyriacigeorgica]|nr:hypothetical protein FMUBM48_08080 [Nocardia cyriacigeorgica]
MRTEIDDITVRSRVMRAALRAAEAQTVPGIEPVDRLKVLRECHGEVLAVRGPGSPLSFEDFRRAVAEDLSRLLPDGVASDEFEQLSSIDQGHIDPTAFDIAAEEQMVLKHVLRKARGSGRLASTSELQSEIEQEMVYTYLRKPGEQRAYEAGRSALIKHPYYPAEDLCDLAIPVSVGEYYQPIPFGSLFRGWWFPCPICRWPMRITAGADRHVRGAKCWHQPHTDMGAIYLIDSTVKDRAPQLIPEHVVEPPEGSAAVLHPNLGTIPAALPADGYRALVRGVWRYTTIPGIPELALYHALNARGLKVELWPGLDAYDLRVVVGEESCERVYAVDIKDFTSARTLGELIHAQEGDAGGADWLVVPDHRAAQLPLLSGVCDQYGLQVATATGFAERICAEAGVAWA